ncbi:MAG: hypothetical protein AAB367_01425 [Patescibacteria group bacterium]
MANKQLLDYVQKSLQSGYSAQEISPALVDKGWGTSEVHEAVLAAQELIRQKPALPPLPPPPSKASEWTIELKSLSASQILLYLGGLIVVLAGLIYIGINWQQWGSLGRIFAIFLPMFICYALGTPLFFKEEYKKHGIVFVVVGSLLFPLFLSIVFVEMKLFGKFYGNSFGMAVSLPTFLLYSMLSFAFRFPIWAGLYQGAGLFVYFYFWKLLGVADFDKEPVLAWLFLILGTAYMVLSLWYERLEKKIEAWHSHILGSLVVVCSLARIFVETLDRAYFSWILIVLGIGYFAFGAWVESNKIKKYCSVAYFIGAGLVFFSLLRLGLDGTLLKDITATRGFDQDIIGWSNIIVGVLYLALSALLSQLSKFGLQEGSRYKEFFDLAGPGLVLSAVFFLGLDGSKPIYETLLLLASLGFIFGSIPKRSRQFLYLGTLFLIVYIFSIGGEYFENDVGWPIILFVAGFVSMGIGVGIEKVRRKYFTASKG